MRSDHQFLAELLLYESRQLLEIERALSGFFGFDDACAEVDDIEIAVDHMRDFVDERHFRHKQAGAVAAVAQRHQLDLVVLVARKLALAFGDSFQALGAGDTELILHALTSDDCDFGHSSLPKLNVYYIVQYTRTSPWSQRLTADRLAPGKTVVYKGARSLILKQIPLRGSA